jgi:hypothetical protein
MATYGSGIASNSVDLWNKIDGYISTTTGWSTYDTFSSGNVKERVYVSDGYSGNEKIYVRMRTGAVDPHRNGVTLKKTGADDGYTGSVAFNMYQYWNATAKDGYGELGVIGPRVIYVRGLNTSQVFITDFQQSILGNWASEIVSNLSIAANTERNSSGVSSPTWDGKKFIYIPSSDYGFTNRHDFIENANAQFANPGAFVSARGAYGTCYVLDSATDTEYLYGFNQSTISGSQFYRLNLTTNAWQGRADPPWSSSAEAGKICWDGYNRLYAIRCQFTTSFAHYNISADTWTSGPALPFTAFRGSNIIYVPGTATRPNRLYANAGEFSAAMARLDLAADGTPSGSWVSTTSAPYGMGDSAEGGCRLYYFGGDYIWAGPTRTLTNQELMRYSITNDNWTNQAGTAGQAYDNWAQVTSHGGGGGALPQNHQTYIPVKDGLSTQFWYFGDADRIAVVTKDINNVYDFLYVGMIDSYYTRQQTTITTTLTPGIEKSVTVTNGAIFSAEQKVSLYDPSGNSAIVSHTGLDGYVRRYVPAEIVTIKSVSGNDLVLYSVSNTYATGTKIGVDLAPYGITGYRNHLIQMNNHIPKSTSAYRAPTSSNTSQNAQLYKYVCPVPKEITTQSANESRTSQYMLWPLVIQNTSTFSGDEVRGQLKGVYIVDDNGTAAAGDVITFQGNTYLLFSFNSTFYNESRLFAFGPLS